MKWSRHFFLLTFHRSKEINPKEIFNGEPNFIYFDVLDMIMFTWLRYEMKFLNLVIFFIELQFSEIAYE